MVTGVFPSAAAAAQGAEPEPASLENKPRFTPFIKIAPKLPPGRLEELLPGVYVDGAHNVGGIRKLRESIAASFAGRPVWLLFAVASDKDYGEMIRILCTIPELKGVTVTEIENYRRTDLETVASIFRKNWHGYVGHSYNINEAITTSEQQAAKYPNAVLICAGSLYLAGSVIEALQR